MVELKEVEAGIARFLDKELADVMPEEMWKRITIGTGVALIVKNLDNIVDKYKDNTLVQLTGVIDEQKRVNVDRIRVVLRSQIPEEGVKVPVPVLGIITFHKSDVDTLYNCIVHPSEV